jgi:hypothetical protein
MEVTGDGEGTSDGISVGLEVVGDSVGISVGREVTGENVGAGIVGSLEGA